MKKWENLNMGKKTALPPDKLYLNNNIHFKDEKWMKHKINSKLLYIFLGLGKPANLKTNKMKQNAENFIVFCTNFMIYIKDSLYNFKIYFFIWQQFCVLGNLHGKL